MPRAALVPDCDYDLFFSYAIEDDDERLPGREETRWVTYFRKCLLRAIDRKVGRRDSIKVFLDRLELESSNAQLSPALKDNLDKTAVFIAIVSTSYLHPESRCNLERKYFLASLGDAPEKHAGRVWIILIEEMPSVRWREAFFPDLRATVFYEKDVDDRVRLLMPGTDAKVDQRFLDRIEDLAQGIALSLKELMIRPPAPSRFTSHALTTPINPSRPQVSSKPLRRPLRAFLCHSSHDKMAVRELYQKLIHDDFFVWFDEENLLPGQQWDTESQGRSRERCCCRLPFSIFNHQRRIRTKRDSICSRRCSREARGNNLPHPG